MTKTEQRAQIRSITRGELRYRGYEPTETDSDIIHRVLDDMARQGGVVANWYIPASGNQIKTILREIRKGIR